MEGELKEEGNRPDRKPAGPQNGRGNERVDFVGASIR